jgi:membrane protein
MGRTARAEMLWRIRRRVSEDNLSVVAAGVAFYAMLAIFPALIALVGLYGVAFDPQQVHEHLSQLTAVLPAQAAGLIERQVGQITSIDRTSLGLGSIAALLVALWSASAAVRALMTALNVVYDADEKRGLIRFYATSLALTLVAIAGGALAIGLIVAVPAALRFAGLGALAGSLIDYARWPLLALLMLASLALMYRYGPSRERPVWRWLNWGALAAVALWLAGSALFSFYVSAFADYNKTYGSLGAVVILLLWFLLTAYAVLIGAELNAEIHARVSSPGTQSPPASSARPRPPAGSRAARRGPDPAAGARSTRSP